MLPPSDPPPDWDDNELAAAAFLHSHGDPECTVSSIRENTFMKMSGGWHCVGGVVPIYFAAADAGLPGAVNRYGNRR
jgi:hypothetical protein